MEFVTLEARLATFEKPSKRSKLGWPHKTPTPEELAKAGFYFKPSTSSNDNTICFLCERALGGWEPDDDPVQEHLKHSDDCGWAILMNIGQDATWDTNEMEDPTGPQITEARRSTFSIGWPHESKRGWTCKVEKMVEAGWHYAPTPDSDDFVSCVYCKLSLDGWEPKDNPFDEHYRRSPECPFFHFAGTTAPSKRPKAKKGRASKASRTSKASTRLSTQSNSTMLSEAPSATDIPDLDESIDASEVSVMSTMSTMSTASTATATKGKRKGTRGKAKTTKAKKAKTTRSTRAKKDQPPQEEVVESQVMEEVTVEVEQTSFQTGGATGGQSPTAKSQEELNLVSTPAAVSYPTIPGSPGAPDEMIRLSPVAAPPQISPTPIKTTRRTSTRRSTTATPRATVPTNTQSVPEGQSEAPRSTPPQSPSPPSDIENAPPSTRPASVRPPVSVSSPHVQIQSQTHTQTVPLAPSSPTNEPTPAWTPSDVELIFQPNTPQPADLLALTGGTLSEQEKSMTVQEWIEYIAEQAEAGLRSEAERVVGIFEQEGQRAMGVLESIACI
ncbi:hypothetical protein ABEF93_005808 [Exophiala dermatitidis]